MAQHPDTPKLEIFEIVAPGLDSLRTVRVHLPEDYKEKKKHYPVLYMHDAQNLFDTATAFGGEWQVDEFMQAQKGQKVIVVGIDHGNEKRISELTPFPNEKYGGGEGAAYVDFLVKTLKPHIDSTYRTLPEAETTAVAGSSLGGLISFYAALTYPEIFGKVGVFSPSFWFSEKIFDLAEAANIPETTRFYFVGGTAESEEMVADLMKMKQILLRQGVLEENLKVKLVRDGQHNEAFWSREFPEAFQWLFSEREGQK
ncbi:alpha/beta hydrolase [Salinimicrobium sp. HB62]|uniref:alpha/beta hydrolase n=1 Tax=Salinimicrobium sp. HB62 TaxID=3077781 RepID=UPI002D775B36|nr:alpha/beta hydrolase-fold protein [Salinimicrobium sp. HB62]